MLDHALAVLVLLALRVSPVAWSLIWWLPSLTLKFALGVALSLSLLPFALRIAPAELALGPQLWAAVPWELARGSLLGFGTLLPVIALAWVGRLHDASRELLSEREPQSPLERLYGAAAIALLFATGAHELIFRALAGSLTDLPLGAALSGLAQVQPVFLGLAHFLARAFELSIILAAPVLLVVLTALAIAAAGARVSPALASALARGPLLPIVGLSAACFGFSSILSGLPQALDVFLRDTLALLPGLR
jgi:flagellar biosynthetic protein FliR